MYLPKLREIREALGSFFSAPYTTKFPGEPYTPDEEFRGFPRYNEEHCVGCGTCAQVCPTNAITVKDSRSTRSRTLTVDYASCIHCGQCNEHCITGKGITPTSEYAFPAATVTAPEMFESVDKQLVLCENCGDPIACRDHLRWVRERLGAKAYAHPGLLLEFQSRTMGVTTARPKEQIRREDYMKQLCPNCRRAVVMTDEF